MGEAEIIAQQHMGAQAPRQRHRQAHEADIHLPLRDEARQRVHRPFAGGDLDRGKAGAEAARLVLQHAGIGGRTDIAEGDAADFAAPRAPAGALRASEALQHRAGLDEEHLARRGERHRAPGAREKPRRQRALDLLDLHGERGRGDVQPLRRAREMQLLGEGYEIAQMPQFHRATAC